MLLIFYNSGVTHTELFKKKTTLKYFSSQKSEIHNFTILQKVIEIVYFFTFNHSYTLKENEILNINHRKYIDRAKATRKLIIICMNKIPYFVQSRTYKNRYKNRVVNSIYWVVNEIYQLSNSIYWLSKSIYEL